MWVYVGFEYMEKRASIPDGMVQPKKKSNIISSVGLLGFSVHRKEENIFRWYFVG